MQRWGGILFYTFLSESSQPRSLIYRILPLFQTDSGTGTDCFFEQFVFSEQFVDWYIGFIILLQFLSNLEFAEKCVLHHLLIIDWCAYLLFAVQRAWAWDYVDFLNRQINPEAKWSEVWSVTRSGENPFFRMRTAYVGTFFLTKVLYGKNFSCNALMFGIYEIFGFWLVLLI